MCRVLILAKSKSKSTGTRVGLSFEAIISSMGGFQGLIHLNGLGNVSARSPATAPAESGKGGNLTNTSLCLCSEVARVFLSLPGCQVVLDVFAIHRNQDVWEDPEVCYLYSRKRR